LGANSCRVHILLLLSITAALFGCRPTEMESRLKWGVHRSARNANILNLLPKQSVEVCADQQEWMTAGQEAIQKWSSAIGRAGHLKVVACGQSADLTINMSGFDSSGLNYFTERPGRILIRSSATGNLLRALALHEYGHSFGLCDQYKDAGSANCSDDKSERQQNDEVMGATNPSKLNLTQGDIEGVRKAASDTTIKANNQWKNYLLNFSSNQDERPFYASLAASSAAERPKIAVSVVQGASFALCRFNGSLAQCESNSPSAIQMQKINSANGRDFYLSTEEISGLSLNSKNIFIVTVKDNSGVRTQKFAINKK